MQVKEEKRAHLKKEITKTTNAIQRKAFLIEEAKEIFGSRNNAKASLALKKIQKEQQQKQLIREGNIKMYVLTDHFPNTLPTKQRKI